MNCPTSEPLYPVDHYSAGAASIRLVNILTARADGAPEDVVTEIIDMYGERGLMSITEATALLLRFVADDLVALLRELKKDYDVDTYIPEIFDRYGEEKALAPHLPRLLAAAGGRTLGDVHALADVIAETGVTPAFPIGLAKTVGMVMRLLELGGAGDIDVLISDAEDRLLILN